MYMLNSFVFGIYRRLLSQVMGKRKPPDLLLTHLNSLTKLKSKIRQMCYIIYLQTAVRGRYEVCFHHLKRFHLKLY